MRILAICNKPPYPPHDGGSLASFNLITSLGRLGHEVTLLTMCTPKHRLTEAEKNRLSEMVSLYIQDVDTSVHPVRFLTNLLFSRLPYNAERFISPVFDKELARLLKSSGFDIVQLEGLYLMPYAETIRHYTAARIVLRAHNVEHEVWSRISQNETSFLRKRYLALLARRLVHFETFFLNRYDLLVPITARDRDEFNRMGNNKPVHVCPAALYVEHLAIPETLPSEPSLFFLGSLDWKPNQEGLLWFVDQVFPVLRPRYPELKFHIAGRNAPEWLIKRIDNPGILFHGEIPDAGVFIRENGILVAPCFSGGGMRIKIIEAMANGKPVITTDMGAEGLDTKHRENILIGHTVDEYVDNLDGLLKFPDFYRKIALNAFAFVQQHFDNMKISAELAAFYKTHFA
jgi:glycosyltransferase involved in cell wall biosynthesis